MANGWTEERRKRQAELILTWEPWAKSTGPRSAAGKAKVAKNAFKGGRRAAIRELTREVECMLRLHRDRLKGLTS
jgi:hypothetical protein